ncbi:MAG: hypothetical protein ACK4GQ_02245 [Candidatus Hadarchaeales archaeon]
MRVAPNAEPAIVGMAFVTITLISVGASLLYYVASEAKVSRRRVEAAVMKSVIRSLPPLNPTQQMELLELLENNRVKKSRPRRSE